MSSVSPGGCRAVIITALPVEFNAVCEHLSDRCEEVHPQGTVYEKGYFRPVGGTEWEVVIAEIGAGNVGAAAEVERAVGFHRPNVVLFVGIAGGVKDVAIGDVVAGSKVYGYESGKESEGFKARPMAHESNYRLVQRAKAEARSGNWRQRIIGAEPGIIPRALVGPIAAGEKVVADTKSATAQLISMNYGDALAVEMEGYGFLHGAYLHQHVAALVVRGISDLLDGKSAADRLGSQERASRTASAFCFEVLARLGGCPGRTVDYLAPGNSVSESPIATTLSLYEARFQAIEKVIGLHNIADLPAETTVDAKYLAEMDSARDLLNSGHAYAARVLLERLRRAAEKEHFDKHFQFRLETNLGAAALLLDEYDVAEQQFEAAYSLKPEDPRAIANCAQVALVLDRPATALERASVAWSLAPDDAHVAGIYLRTLGATGQGEEAVQIARDRAWMQSDPKCALELARIHFAAAKYTEAEQLARASLQADPDNAQTMELLARCIVVPVQAELDRNPPLPGRIPSAVLGRASEAESLLSKAISILEHQDHRGLLLAALANRGTTLTLLGRNEEAQRDYDHVLSESPEQSVVKVNKARLLLGSGSPHEALELLEGLDAETRVAAWHPLSVAYLSTQQPRKSLQVLKPQWEHASDGLSKVRAAELLLEAYSAVSDFAGASKIASVLQAEFGADPEAMAAVAEWSASQPDGYDQAVGLFFGALDAATDNHQKDRITLSLADLYYRNQRFPESADLYGKLVPYFDHPALFRRYVLSLFYAGSYREALRLVADKRAGGRAIPFVSAIEAHLLEKAGDLQSAERLLAELVELEPDYADHRIGLAHLRYRRGDYEGAKRAVLGVSADDVEGNAHQLLALAKVRAWLELDGVLELAYRARRAGFDHADVHQGYVSLFLNRKREQDARLEVTQIGPGTTVHLKSVDGQERVFTIVDGLDADLHRGELLASDPIALKLIGHVPGDYVTLKQTELETVTFQITHIKSQYVYAFQETLSNFSTWFPEESEGPEKVTVDDGSVEKVLELVGRRHSYVESVLELYRSNRITLGMLAQLIGRSVIEVWSGLQEGGDTQLIASTGEQETAVAEAADLTSTQELVLDLVAVLTFACLGLLPALKKRFSALLTTQFVLDEIRDELTLERAGLRKTGSLYIRDGRYVMEPAPAIASGERRSFLEGIAEFLRHDVSVQPISSLLDFSEDQKEPLGPAALASILLAKERGSVLCSDDLLLRVIAKNSWGVSGVWSQAVIMELARGGHISEAEYHRATMELVQRNYSFVRVHEGDYLWLLREEGMRVTSRFVTALGVLKGPNCTEESAVMVAGALLRDICLESKLRKTRHLLIDACISVLKQGRQPGIVLSKLDAHCQRLMLMNPECLQEVTEAIALWKSERDLIEEKVRIRNIRGRVGR